MYNYSFPNIVFARDIRDSPDKVLRCFYCRRPLAGKWLPVATIDHLWPDSLGGSGRPCNLISACHSCNAKRGIELPDGIKDNELDWIDVGVDDLKIVKKARREEFKQLLRKKVNGRVVNAFAKRKRRIQELLDSALGKKEIVDLLDE